MVESRCGIVCAGCEYQESMGCKGCLNISKPFWGEFCPVKDCCEGKGFEHCGLCPDIPCQLLTDFAYDKEQGDEGKRIETCLAWALAGQA